ncbi:MAG: hypothetical protein AVW06_01230 [Hadesarchaea archaeon DG-33-1]|nr:MAG: hypothetical protein AVW06_01230 [Hadesarchaea archaeon DG-33-1]
MYVGFDESRNQLIRNAESFGWNFEEYEKKGLLVIRSIYASEKLPDEHLADITQIVESKKIKRCVFDSLSAVSNSFPEDIFTSFTRRLIGYLKTKNVTTLLTATTGALVGAAELIETRLLTMADNIITLRHVEMESKLGLVLNIIKVRGSAHSKALRRYDITSKGIVVGPSLAGYEGIMTGVTRKVSETFEEKLESEFKTFIGPMATSVFLELKSRGLTKENIFSYIDELTNQGIIKKEDASTFKQNVDTIILFHLAYDSKSNQKTDKKNVDGISTGKFDVEIGPKLKR